MRIISGKYKGRNIVAPASLPVRPTTDFAKTALFNILSNHFDFAPFDSAQGKSISVLDLFCGTGSISFEFASRGVEKITAVDEHAGALKFIKEFSNKLQSTAIKTVKSDVLQFLKHTNGKFDIIFADPPFDWELTDTIPGLVFERNLLNAGGWLIVEHQSKRKLITEIEQTDLRIYGNVGFSIFASPPQS